MNQDYVRGFTRKCAANGVDPTDLLLKAAARGDQLAKLIAAGQKGLVDNQDYMRSGLRDHLEFMNKAIADTPALQFAPAVNRRAISRADVAVGNKAKPLGIFSAHTAGRMEGSSALPSAIRILRRGLHQRRMMAGLESAVERGEGAGTAVQTRLMQQFGPRNSR